MNELWVAVVLGIVEGLTEFLPVSSTGHLILADHLLRSTATGLDGEKMKTFEIFIQLGAILAVAVLYRKRIYRLFGWEGEGEEAPSPGSRRLTLTHVALAIAPAMVLGLLLHGTIKAYLFTPYTVVIGLVIGGIFMIYAEKRHARVRAKDMDQLTYKQALQIGLAQCLALWPGFSRSGATIAGGLLCGTSHKAAADFSFLIAIPMMLAATGFDLLKTFGSLTREDLSFFAVGFAVSFVVALLAVVSFLKLLDKVKLTPFAWYRFAVAGLFWFFVMN